MIIHKLLICITATIPLGFNLSLIVMPYISLHCASSDKRWAKKKKKTHTPAYPMYNTRDNVSPQHKERLLMCSWGEVWIEEGWRPDGTAGSGYLLKLRICPYSQSRWCLWQVDGARAGKAEAQDGKSALRRAWPITTPLSGVSLDSAGILSGHLVHRSQWDRGTVAEFSYTGPQGCGTQSIQNRFTESLT